MLDMTMRQAGVGQAIKSARLARGWKQKELAAAVHVEPQTVSNWERGVTMPDLEILAVISKETKQPLSYFVAEEHEIRASASLTEVAQQLAVEVGRLVDVTARLERRLDEAALAPRRRKQAASR